MRAYGELPQLGQRDSDAMCAGNRRPLQTLADLRFSRHVYLGSFLCNLAYGANGLWTAYVSAIGHSVFVLPELPVTCPSLV